MRKLGRAAAALLAVGFAAAAYLYLSLPDVRTLRTRNPETTAFIELRLREARAKGLEPRRVQRWVAYGRISANLKRAVLVAEDSGFWQHEGIEFEQMKESMEVNIERMEFARGGSTITQQLAKNLYLSPSKNPIRKVREILIARRLEAELPKQRILELYLESDRVGRRHLRRGGRGAHLFRQVGGRSRALRSGAARRRDRQSAHADARAAHGAAAPPAADDPAADGGRHAPACGGRRARRHPPALRDGPSSGSGAGRAPTWRADVAAGRARPAAACRSSPSVRASALRLSD